MHQHNRRCTRGMSRVEKIEHFTPDRGEGCWPWSGARVGGYGVIRIDGKDLKAHRFVYETLVGPIPEGHDIDHVVTAGCLSKACVNPKHLEAVTERENTRRYWASDAGRARERTPLGRFVGHVSSRLD